MAYIQGEGFIIRRIFASEIWWAYMYLWWGEEEGAYFQNFMVFHIPHRPAANPDN